MTQQSEAHLVVLAYSSFIESWGPGPDLAKEFENQTQLKVRFVEAGDSTLLLERLRFKNSQDRIDMVIGLDESVQESARRSIEWQTIAADQVRWVKEIKPKTMDLVPYDYGILTFIYRKGEIEPPQKIDDLLLPRFKDALSLQDPRTSTPGLNFLYWILTIKGQENGFKFLNSLENSTRATSQSWSTSYGLFKSKQAKMVYSYTTSVLFHLLEEKNSNFAAVKFAEGHARQIELMGIPSSCLNCFAAQKFAQFLLTPRAQGIIARKNFMLAVVEGVSQNAFVAPNIGDREMVKDLLSGFETLTFAPELEREKEKLLQKWKEIHQ